MRRGLLLLQGLSVAAAALMVGGKRPRCCYMREVSYLCKGVSFSIQLLAAPSVEGGKKKKKKGSSLDKMLAESDRLDKKMADAQRRQEEKRKKCVRTMNISVEFISIPFFVPNLQPPYRARAHPP